MIVNMIKKLLIKLGIIKDNKKKNECKCGGTFYWFAYSNAIQCNKCWKVLDRGESIIS